MAGLFREIDLTGAELQRLLSEPNFFGKLHPYLSTLFSSNPVGALNEGVAFLNQIRVLNDAAYKQQHKGNPFYWLGIAAFLARDYETAVFFFDGAVSEDIRNGADPTKCDTPALKFAYLQGNTRGHAAQPLVKTLLTTINRELTAYNSRPGRVTTLSNLNIRHLRHNFIGRLVRSPDKHLRTVTTTFNSYFLEWEYRNKLAEIGVGIDTTEPFFIHLFKGCLLFESLLKANPKKPPQKDTLGRVLKELSSELGVPSHIDVRSPSFAAILPTTNPNDSLPVAIERTGRIRNTLGHHLGWPASLTSSKYNLLASDIAASCLHAINSLYR